MPSRLANKTLIVTVPPTTTRSSLQQVFSEFGQVENATVVCDEKSRAPNREWTATLGYAFVSFATREAAEKAIAVAETGQLKIKQGKVRGTWAKKDSYPSAKNRNPRGGGRSQASSRPRAAQEFDEHLCAHAPSDASFLRTEPEPHKRIHTVNVGGTQHTKQRRDKDKKKRNANREDVTTRPPDFRCVSANGLPPDTYTNPQALTLNHGPSVWPITRCGPLPADELSLWAPGVDFQVCNNVAAERDAYGDHVFDQYPDIYPPDSISFELAQKGVTPDQAGSSWSTQTLEALEELLGQLSMNDDCHNFIPAVEQLLGLQLVGEDPIVPHGHPLHTTYLSSNGSSSSGSNGGIRHDNAHLGPIMQSPRVEFPQTARDDLYSDSLLLDCESRGFDFLIAPSIGVDTSFGQNDDLFVKSPQFAAGEFIDTSNRKPDPSVHELDDLSSIFSRPNGGIDFIANCRR